MAEAVAYVYDKNRRYPVPAGTRCANVLLHTTDPEYAGLNEEQRRLAAQHQAMTLAAMQWESTYGAVPWQDVQYLVTHTSCQVVVEMRVEPRTGF